MHEIEQISDRVGIVAKGRLVAEGTVDDLRGEDHLLVRVDPDRVDASRGLLSSLPGLRVHAATNGVLQVEGATGDAPEAFDAAAINTRLVANGVAVHELRPERASLESVFFALTGTNPFTSEEAHDA